MIAGRLAGVVGRMRAEVADSARGVVRLLRFDPGWADAFDFSTEGFLRSFAAPILAMPCYLFATLVWSRAAGGGGAVPPVWIIIVSHGFNALAYPLIVGALARPLGFGAGFASFVVVTNWGGLLFDAAVAAAAAPVLLTGAGLAVFRLIALLLFGASLFFTWRAGRETLSAEMAPVLMGVVLAVGVGALSDQLAVWLFAATRATA